MKKEKTWTKLTGDYPYPVVSALGISADGRVILLKRSQNVRSARGVWSIPSGLHEVGVGAEDMMKREFKEELGLEADKFSHVTTYENILPEEAPMAHWVIQIFVCRLHHIDRAVNLEPDKHEKMLITTFADFADMVMCDAVPWHATLRSALLRNMRTLRTHMLRFTEENR